MTESEAYEAYNESLSDCNINQLVSMSTGDMLKELDPTMYDCGFADFCDAEDIEIE